jgi:hypothetical protein
MLLLDPRAGHLHRPFQCVMVYVMLWPGVVQAGGDVCAAKFVLPELGVALALPLLAVSCFGGGWRGGGALPKPGLV